MAIKNFDTATGKLTGLTSETSGVRDDTRPQVNQKLNTFDFTNLYLKEKHFISEQDRCPELIDKIWTLLYEGTQNTNVRVHHVLVYEQVMEGNPYRALTLKLLAVYESMEGKHCRLYNIDYTNDFDGIGYKDIYLKEKDIILLDILKKLESHGIVLALELTEENNYVLSLIDNHDNVGFRLGYTATRSKSGVEIRTNLTAYHRDYESESANVNDIIQGFCVTSESLTGMVGSKTFNESITDEVVNGILLLAYSLFDTYIESTGITVGTSKDRDPDYINFYIGYNVEQKLESGNKGSGKITVNHTGYKKVSFSIDKRNKEQMLSMIKSFEAFRNKLIVNKYGYNPSKLNRDIEEKIVKDFSNIVDVVSAYRLL